MRTLDDVTDLGAKAVKADLAPFVTLLPTCEKADLDEDAEAATDGGGRGGRNAGG